MKAMKTLTKSELDGKIILDDKFLGISVRGYDLPSAERKYARNLIGIRSRINGLEDNHEERLKLPYIEEKIKLFSPK